MHSYKLSSIIGGLCFLCIISVKAQQPLNLDFEKKSMEGISRPWGWDIESVNDDTRIFLDSSIAHNGKMSLCISASKPFGPGGLPVLNYDIEPYSFAGRKIIIRGWIKGEKPGNIIYLITGYHTTSGSVADTVKQLATAGNWQEIGTALQIPKNAEILFVKLAYNGTGNVWFDDFSIAVNGKKIKEAVVAPEFTTAGHTWFSQHTSSFSSVDAEPPGAPAAGDLAFFKKNCEGAQIIGLGESTHGTSEFFRLKHRLLAYAVKEMGVRIFAIEDNQAIVQRVNKYVMEGTGTARESMYGMFSVWQNEEVKNMIHWVRDYNDLHPNDKISFVGFDMQDIKSSADSLLGFLRAKDVSLYDTASFVLKSMLQNVPLHYNATDSSKRVWLGDAIKIFNKVTDRQHRWLASSGSESDSLRINMGIQFANLVKQYARNLLLGHLSFYRDTAMAENISWILAQHKPGTRIVVWAHDTHISRGDHPLREYNMYNGISMGANLSKKYGARYKAFSLSSYTGFYWAQVSYTNFRGVACPLFTAPRGSIDEALHRIAYARKNENVFLDLVDARTQPWLSKPLPTRFANHVSFEYAYWTRYSIPYQFDGIFFIDTTGAAKSYAR
jgi:erythromycin esterase